MGVGLLAFITRGRWKAIVKYRPTLGFACVNQQVVSTYRWSKGLLLTFNISICFQAWLSHIFANTKLLAELMAAQPSTISFVLSTLKWGLQSDNEVSFKW